MNSKPNLQNIPIRTEIGRRLRDAFAEQHEPMPVDYSELELQTLAAIETNTALRTEIGRELAKYYKDTPVDRVTIPEVNWTELELRILAWRLKDPK